MISDEPVVLLDLWLTHTYHSSYKEVTTVSFVHRKIPRPTNYARTLEVFSKSHTMKTR